jgi:hypothetical protein
MATKHREGLEAFIAWCRQYPAAAQDLMDAPAGLRWLASHSS